MKRLAYAGGSLVTGDAVTDAVLDYAAALARAGQADRIRVPALGVDDEITVFDMVIGPASQLIAEPVDVDHDELVDPELVADLRLRGRRARAGHFDDRASGEG
jgi:hypothetical protein